MRVFCLVVIFFVWCDAIAQTIKKPKPINRHAVTRVIKKSLRRDHGFNAGKIKEFVVGLQFQVIPSYIVSRDGVYYDDKSRITSFLLPNKKRNYEYVLVYKDQRYVGSLDCSNAVLFGGNEKCVFNDSPVDAKFYGNFELFRGVQLLISQNATFVFSVRYFRNCLWFLHDGEVSLLDLSNFAIYNPDEFIKKKCSPRVIQNLVRGDLSIFCD